MEVTENLYHQLFSGNGCGVWWQEHQGLRIDSLAEKIKHQLWGLQVAVPVAPNQSARDL